MTEYTRQGMRFCVKIHEDDGTLPEGRLPAGLALVYNRKGQGWFLEFDLRDPRVWLLWVKSVLHIPWGK